MNVQDIREKYAVDNVYYRGATVAGVKKKLKSALSKLKIQNLRDSPFGGYKFMAKGNDFEVVTQGQSGDPSHIGSLIVGFRGPSGRERAVFEAFGQEESAIRKAVEWCSQRIK